VTSIRDHEMDVDTARARSRIYAQLAQGFSGPEEGLEAEYARLFVGPGKPIAHPYESVHRERRMMGDCALVVRSLYAGEGLIPEANLGARPARQRPGLPPAARIVLARSLGPLAAGFLPECAGRRS
jgi:hypothetical protein